MGSGPVGGAENHQAEQEEPWPSGIPLSAELNVPDSPPQPPRDRAGGPAQTSGALGNCKRKRKGSKREKAPPGEHGTPWPEDRPTSSGTRACTVSPPRGSRRGSR